MNIKVSNILMTIGFAVLMTACQSGPKVIEGQATNEAMAPNTLPSLGQSGRSNQDAASTIHQVVVEEVLTTEKYNYLNVKEGDQKFWIAISKIEVKEGETYFFRGGLLKRNFFSKEFNRVFDTVYLVSEIWANNSSAPQAPMSTSSAPHGAMTPSLEVGQIELASGAISLADLFAKKESYKGQTIKITGKCVKVNPNILGRNWLHIQDGSGDELDLTVTTSENVSLGSVVTMEGTITLDKDFGAGYRYDIIMEGASVVQ